MKIKIKYYDVWGKSQTQTITLSSKGRVKDLRIAISQQLNIQTEHMTLYLLNNNKQMEILKGDFDYLSYYHFSQDSLILLKNEDDYSPSVSQRKSTITRQSINNQLAIEFGSTTSNTNILEKDLYDLYEAIRLNKFMDVKQILCMKCKQQLINDITIMGWSAMHLAVFCGNEKIFLHLLSEGGDLNLETKDGWDCLTIAVWQRQKTILNLMLSQQVLDINKITKHGTALHLAAELDDKEMVQLLLNHPKIDINLLNDNYQLAQDLAGPSTQLLLQYNTQPLMDSFRQSMSGITLSQLSTNSFLINRPKRPPIISGYIYKVSFLKLILTKQFMLVDPDSGLITRYKKETDVPLNPSEIIPLELVNDVKQSKNEWFQRRGYQYLEIKYSNEHVYIAFEHKAAARQWYESLKNCVGYVRYLSNKIQCYQKDKQQKNYYKLMLEKQNQIINIKDVRGIDQQEYLQIQQEIKKMKFQQSLESVSEVSYYEGDNEIENQISSRVSPLKIKDFTIIEQIGRGSFGNVFRAILKLNNKMYALKQQEKAKINQNKLLKYVCSELQIMKKLHHPFIATMEFSFQTQFNLYLAIEYCPKGDLSKYMTRGIILNEFDAKLIIAQIILAIEYLHSKQIIYRDLKPENILIDEEGYIKLTDFGLSKQVDDDQFIAQSFCGSPAYLPPELVAGVGSTKATDIYQIGTILYEMLTGFPPFYCHNIRKLMHDIRYAKLQIPKTVSASAANLLIRMLEKTPQSRLGENNINVLKKHIFFAEIDWNKLVQKKYSAPKLKLREDYKISRNGFNFVEFQKPEYFDVDYVDGQQQLDYVEEWDFGY